MSIINIHTISGIQFYKKRMMNRANAFNAAKVDFNDQNSYLIMPYSRLTEIYLMRGNVQF